MSDQEHGGFEPEDIAAGWARGGEIFRFLSTAAAEGLPMAQGITVYLAAAEARFERRMSARLAALEAEVAALRLAARDGAP